MEFHHLLKDCKEVLLKLLDCDEKRFEISLQSKRLIHKCSIFSTTLHTIEESEVNIVYLKKLKGTLIATQAFIDDSNVIINTAGRSPVSTLSSTRPVFNEKTIGDSEKSTKDVEYTNLCIRIAHVAHDLVSTGASTNDQDLLIEDCLELVNHIQHVDVSENVNPDDCRKFVQSCRVFTELLHNLSDTPATVEELTAFRATLKESMNFIASNVCTSVLAETVYHINHGLYKRTVDQLVFRIARHTHRLEALVPGRGNYLLPFSTHTIAFECLRKECKELQKYIIHVDDTGFANPADCRQIVHFCRLFSDPLSDITETENTLVALHELHDSLMNAKSFLETYTSTSILGETIFLATRSIYNKRLEDVIGSVGHDLNVLQHACAVQKASAQFHTTLRECKTQLSDVLQIGETITSMNERDLLLILHCARGFVHLLHNCKESVLIMEALQRLKDVLKEVHDFILMFETKDKTSSKEKDIDFDVAARVVSLEEYSQDLTVLLAKMSDCAQSFVVSTPDDSTDFAHAGSSCLQPVPKSLYPQSSRSLEYASSRGWSRSSNYECSSNNNSRSSTPIDSSISPS